MSDLPSRLRSLNRCRRTALPHELLEEAACQIERLQTSIFNAINDLDKKKPNTKAVRRYLASAYNRVTE